MPYDTPMPIALTGPFDVVKHGDWWWVTDNGFRIACMCDLGSSEEYARLVASSLSESFHQRIEIDRLNKVINQVIDITEMNEYDGWVFSKEATDDGKFPPDAPELVEELKYRGKLIPYGHQVL